MAFVFFFVRHEGTDSETDMGDVIVVLDTFKSKILKIEV